MMIATSPTPEYRSVENLSQPEILKSFVFMRPCSGDFSGFVLNLPRLSSLVAANMEYNLELQRCHPGVTIHPVVTTALRALSESSLDSTRYAADVVCDPRIQEMFPYLVDLQTSRLIPSLGAELLRFREGIALCAGRDVFQEAQTYLHALTDDYSYWALQRVASWLSAEAPGFIPLDTLQSLRERK